MDNFKIITNLRTNESGEDDLSIEWVQEDNSLPSFDNPLTDISLDQLDRFSFAKKIAKAIAKRKNDGSVVMGLYGSPGEGKTTVLNFLKYELAKFGHLASVRFNPSKSANSSRLIQAFFNELSDTIEDSGDISSSLRKKIVHLLNSYSSFLAPEASKDSGQKKLKLFKKSPVEIKKKLDASFRKLEKRVVFLIDDLDKTELNEVKTFFRLIKLSACFPNSVFVLSFDEPSLAAMLGEQYKNDHLLAGRKILDKAVHLSLQIPPAQKGRLLEMCHDGISQILSELRLSVKPARMKEFKEKFNAAFTLKIKTPRQCRLYLNTLGSTLPGQGAGLDTHSFMLVEALRVFYPELFEVIRNNPETFLGVELNKSLKGEVEGNISLYAVNKALENLPVGEKEALKKLLSYLFPCLSGILGFGTGNYLQQNPWIEEKPVASKQYFSRYFLLNTSGTDDFQREVDRLLLRGAAGNVNDLALSVKKLVRQAGTDAFITAIENRIDEVSPIASGNLIRAFAQTGGSFLNPDTLFSFTTIYSHPAVLIRKLLLNIPDVNDRYSIAGFLMKESEPVSFAFECLRWIRTTDGQLQQERIFTPEIEEELSRILTERIKNLAYRYPVYLTMPQEAALILSVWSFLGSREETTRYLESTFRKEPGNVVEFLKCYMPEEFLENPKYELNGSFLLNLSSSVSRVIDSKIVYNQLEKADTAITAGLAAPPEENGFRHRLLSELAGISGDSHTPNHAKNQLKVFRINDYGKDNTKKISENKTSSEETQRGSLTQVSKGLYRPLYDLFN